MGEATRLLGAPAFFDLISGSAILTFTDEWSRTLAFRLMRSAILSEDSTHHGFLARLFSKPNEFVAPVQDIGSGSKDGAPVLTNTGSFSMSVSS